MRNRPASATTRPSWRAEAARPALARAMATASALLLLSACGGVEVQNRQAAEELAQRSKPPGSVYTGWRVFQARCAGCHGPAADGGTGGPNLLALVRGMGPREFVGLVLTRYDWDLPAAPPASGGSPRESLIDDVVEREQGELTMPAWQGEPRVTAHIADLYAYLSARAQGEQGPGVPRR